jgi:hypothetical protein
MHASGDIAVVLFGGKAPYILRSTETGYDFMCETYIDDIMHGELFEELDGIQRPEESFLLQ